MRFPSADRYNEAVQNPAHYFADQQVKRRRVQTDALGLPEVLSGGFAFTYRFTGVGNDIAVRCFHREIPELFERYRNVSAFLATMRSRFFVEFEFNERGVLIDGELLPIVWMRWVEGETLLGYVARRRSEPDALDNLRNQLLEFAEEAESRGYAHGDVQHRNLMVTPNGELKLVDYDGIYVPALRHLKAADAGHPHFQPPSRVASDFGPRMDRFPLAVIDLSLEAIARDPALFDQFHRGENLILSRSDFLDPAASPVLNAIARVPGLVPRVAAFCDLCSLAASELPSLRDFRAGPSYIPVGSPQRPPSSGAGRQAYMSPFDVVDGMDYLRAIKFVGRPVEMIGRVIRVLDLQDKGLVILRFGTSYNQVPSVAIPTSIFAKWAGSRNVKGCWISVTGVLQTHRAGKYSTVQVLVKEASDVELLTNGEEAKYRLGRITRSAPVPPHQAKPAAPLGSGNTPPAQTGPLGRWKITRDASPGVPTWVQDVNKPATPSGQQQGTATPSNTASSMLRGMCPSCGWDNNMPIGATTILCSRCGTRSDAVKWRPTISPGVSSPPSTPSSSSTRATPSSAPKPQPSPRKTSSPPSPSAGNPTNPWQSAQAAQSSGASSGAGATPKIGGLFARLRKILGRIGP